MRHVVVAALCLSSPTPSQGFRRIGTCKKIIPTAVKASEIMSLADPLSLGKRVIEVERKVELADATAVAAFEKKVIDAGGVLVNEKSFTDSYFDSPDLVLTREDHYLRTRDGVWELKVPEKHRGHGATGAATSVYEEIEGLEPIASYFSSRFVHGTIATSCQSFPILDMDLNSGALLSPFVTFTTTRRKWKVDIAGEVFSIDVVSLIFALS